VYIKLCDATEIGDTTWYYLKTNAMDPDYNKQGWYYDMALDEEQDALLKLLRNIQTMQGDMGPLKSLNDGTRINETTWGILKQWAMEDDY